MISEIINQSKGNSSKLIASISWKLMLFLPLFLFAFSGSAHSVLISEYLLKQQQGQWVLSFKQKTRALRDDIYRIQPNLKGQNLNGEAFLMETSNYILQNFKLVQGEKTLQLSPLHMNYGGLKFSAQFLVEGLTSMPHELMIRTAGFDEHEHAIKTLSIRLGEQEYFNAFTQKEPVSVFSLASKTYQTPVLNAPNSHPIWMYVIVSVFVLFIGFAYVKNTTYTMMNI